MIATQNLAYNRPIPLLTLPTQHTTDTHHAPSPTHSTPRSPSNISPPIRLPFYSTPIPHHSMISLIQPAHRELLNLFIRLKHPHSHPKNTILLFSASSSHLNPTPHTSISRMGTRKRHKGAQLRMTLIFFVGSDAQCTTTIKQHGGRDESNSNFLGQTNLHSIISGNIHGLNTKKSTRYN